MNTLRITNKLRLFQPKKMTKITAVFCRGFSDSPIIDLPDNPDIRIPKPKDRPNEPIEQQRSRLLYQSRKRGMLENDLLLSTFVDKHLADFRETQLVEYDKLINGPSNDWDLYYWVTDKQPTPLEYQFEVMDMLKLHVKNLNREVRIRQPDL